MNKEDVRHRITKNGAPLEKNVFDWFFTWNDKDKKLYVHRKYVFDSSRLFLGEDEDGIALTKHWLEFNEFKNLVFDFSGVDGIFFDVPFVSSSKFTSGSNCKFITYTHCEFTCLNSCIFSTNDKCAFNTGSYCKFDTGFDCKFNTGSYCKFDTGFRCHFKTLVNCKFDTRQNCSFETLSGCEFTTEHSCEFKIFKNGRIKRKRDLLSRVYNSKVEFIETVDFKESKHIKLNGHDETGFIELKHQHKGADNE